VAQVPAYHILGQDGNLKRFAVSSGALPAIAERFRRFERRLGGSPLRIRHRFGMDNTENNRRRISAMAKSDSYLRM
jgi:hypothetical protein